jgi:hypothetical protein
LAIEQIRKSRIHTPLGSEVEINPRIVHDPEIGKIIKHGLVIDCADDGTIQLRDMNAQ